MEVTDVRGPILARVGDARGPEDAVQRPDAVGGAGVGVGVGVGGVRHDRETPRSDTRAHAHCEGAVEGVAQDGVRSQLSESELKVLCRTKQRQQRFLMP